MLSVSRATAAVKLYRSAYYSKTQVDQEKCQRRDQPVIDAFPAMTIAATNTRSLVDPTLTFTGVTAENGAHFQWLCHSDGLDVRVPENCRG
jgi:hypothetical protein